jgi:bifunctional DNA-binding transcriptional regulator/antitoxin component of YhaV-PrlF toxin-antitoxin module
LEAGVEERRVDSQGRLILPPDWRREEMAGERDVYVIKRKGYLKILPKRRVDLEAFFDGVDLGVEAIGDWGEFENRFHGGGDEVSRR